MKVFPGHVIESTTVPNGPLFGPICCVGRSRSAGIGKLDGPALRRCVPIGQAAQSFSDSLHSSVNSFWYQVSLSLSDVLLTKLFDSLILIS